MLKDEKFFLIKRLKTAMDVLTENGIKIPEELSSMHSNLCDELLFSEDYITLRRDIGKIIPINNLRYLIWDISIKTKLSLEDISILIGCLPDTLDNLAHVTSAISKEDFQKFANHYGIKHFDYWNRQHIKYIY